MKAIIFLLLLFSVSVNAISPEIAIQQKRLEFEQKNWDDVRLPKGVTRERGSHDIRHSGYNIVSLQAHNLILKYVEDLDIDIQELKAFLAPTAKQQPVTLNDISTFKIEILRGDIILPPKSLEYLFNRHVLNYKGRSLRNVRITTSKDVLTINADIRLKKPYPQTWIKAKLDTTVSIDDNSNIVLTITDVSALNLPLGTPLRLLKLKLEHFLELQRDNIKLKGRSIYISLDILPKPQLVGQVSNAKVENGGLRLFFESDTPIIFDQPPEASNSFLWLQSGDLKVGDLMILNGNMQAISNDKSKRLSYHLYNFWEQVLNSELRITPQGEVVASMPDKY